MNKSCRIICSSSINKQTAWSSSHLNCVCLSKTNKDHTVIRTEITSKYLYDVYEFDYGKVGACVWELKPIMLRQLEYLKNKHEHWSNDNCPMYADYHVIVIFWTYRFSSRSPHPNIDVHHLSLNCCNNKFANESVMCFKSNLLWFESSHIRSKSNVFTFVQLQQWQ